MKTIIYSDINIPFGISKQLTFSEIALLKNIVLGNIDFFKKYSVFLEIVYFFHGILTRIG